MKITDRSFFTQDGYALAQQLIGTYICRNIDGVVHRRQITKQNVTLAQRIQHVMLIKAEQNAQKLCGSKAEYAMCTCVMAYTIC